MFFLNLRYLHGLSPSPYHILSAYDLLAILHRLSKVTQMCSCDDVLTRETSISIGDGVMDVIPIPENIVVKNFQDLVIPALGNMEIVTESIGSLPLA
jgi:hypothetical protein